MDTLKRLFEVDRPVYVFMTGGHGSTFRTVELLRGGRRVVPIFLNAFVDFHRRSAVLADIRMRLPESLGVQNTSAQGRMQGTSTQRTNTQRTSARGHLAAPMMYLAAHANPLESVSSALDFLQLPHGENARILVMLAAISQQMFSPQSAESVLDSFVDYTTDRDRGHDTDRDRGHDTDRDTELTVYSRNYNDEHSREYSDDSDDSKKKTKSTTARNQVGNRARGTSDRNHYVEYCGYMCDHNPLLRLLKPYLDAEGFVRHVEHPELAPLRFMRFPLHVHTQYTILVQARLEGWSRLLQMTDDDIERVLREHRYMNRLCLLICG